MKVRSRDGYTNWIQLVKGIRQGGPKSPALFNIFINPLLEKIRREVRGLRINGIDVPILAFADGLLLITESKEEGGEGTQNCQQVEDEVQWGQDERHLAHRLYE